MKILKVYIDYFYSYDVIYNQRQDLLTGVDEEGNEIFRLKYLNKYNVPYELKDENGNIIQPTIGGV